MCALIVQCSIAITPKTIQEESLQNVIFKNYNPQIRPVEEHSLPVKVGISMFLLTINSVNEKEQYITGHVWLNIMWTDFRLAWNLTEYNGIRRIVVDDRRVWKPDIAIRNLLGNRKGFDDTSFHNAVMNSNGDVELWPGKDMKLWCSIDTTKFPFDDQRCEIHIGKWYSLDEEVQIFPSNDNIYLDWYEINEEWELDSTSVHSRLDNEAGNFTRLIFTLNLKRRPLSTVVNFIIPLILLSCLNQMCFLLPIESGEKLGMCMAIFLTFAVFLTLISDHLPRSSVNIPAFNLYLVMQTAISGFTIASEVLVLNVYNVDSAHASRFMVRLKTIFNFGCHMCSHGQEQSKRPFEPMAEMRDDKKNTTEIKVSSTKDNSVNSFEYSKLAVRIDRFIFRCMCVVNFALISSFFVFVTI